MTMVDDEKEEQFEIKPVRDAVTTIHAGTEQVKESRSQNPMDEFERINEEEEEQVEARGSGRSGSYKSGSYKQRHDKERYAYIDKERAIFLLLYYQCNKLRHYASDCLDRLLKIQEANPKKQTEEWLIAHNEISKLHEETIKRFVKANKTMGDRRVKKKKKVVVGEDEENEIAEEAEAELDVGIPVVVSENNKNKTGVVLILEKTSLEVAKVGKTYQLNPDDHANFLRKNGRYSAHYRPDITHQAILMILDSPVNKAGRLKAVYIRTEQGVLFEVKTHVCIPRTYKRFAGIMLQLLQKLDISAAGRSEKLMRVIKNPVKDHLPSNCRKIGFSCTSEKLVNLQKHLYTVSYTFVLTTRNKVACCSEKKQKEEIVDIDSAYDKDDLAAVEYVEDIYRFYESVESKWRPSDYMRSHNEINEKMRMILVEWLVDVRIRFLKPNPETFDLTLNIIDRFFSGKPEKTSRFMEICLVNSTVDMLVDSENSVCEKTLLVLDAICECTKWRTIVRGNELVNKIVKISESGKKYLVSVLWKIGKTGDDTEVEEALRLGTFKMCVVMLQIGCGKETKEYDKMLKAISDYIYYGGEDSELQSNEDDGKSVKVTVKGKQRRTHFEFDGNRYKLEGPMLLVSADKNHKKYVVFIKGIMQTKDGSMMVLEQLFYRPGEAEKKCCGNWQSSDTRELLYSFHRDEVLAETVMHRCLVYFDITQKHKVNSVFIIRKVYDTVEKKLWKLTDKKCENTKQHVQVKKSMVHLGYLSELEPKEVQTDLENLLKAKRSFRKVSLTSVNVRKEERVALRSQHKTDVEVLNREHEETVNKTEKEDSKWCSKVRHGRVDLCLGIETQKKELGYCIIDKREELVTSSRERDKFLEQEKKLEEEHIQFLKLAKTEHVQVELKRLENLNVALFKWKIAVRFNMSNKEESGMENYSMIHTLMEQQSDSDTTRCLRNVGCCKIRPELSCCVRMTRQDMQRFEGFRRTVMTIHATVEVPIIGDIGRGHRTDLDDGKSVSGHIFYSGGRSTTWGSSKLETVFLPSCKAKDMAGTEAMEQAIWLRNLHRREQRRDNLMTAFGKLKLKEMRDIDEDLSKMISSLRGRMLR
ncbi:uncharacterized protein LOC130497703 [Raphanus sativus]|uniref:Uncharacterized protein LOC130497703 n=1 Tax=Raphanus sativus TaxID=3726 RepID=A0A9W3C511_RAPSA|nr:uncharacterized protein LOC130497703 [Raphanus sativus]